MISPNEGETTQEGENVTEGFIESFFDITPASNNITDLKTQIESATTDITINLDPGIYEFDSEVINKLSIKVTLIGALGSDGKPATQFLMNSSVTGSPRFIRVDSGTLDISNVEVIGTKDKNGGVSARNVFAKNCIFEKNYTTDGVSGGGAIRSNGGTLMIEDSVFNQNSATPTSDGGAVSSQYGGDVYINNSVFDNNSRIGNGNQYGGAISIKQPSVKNTTITITNSIFTNNILTATGTMTKGGAISIYSTPQVSSVTIDNVLFKGNKNTSRSGGAIAFNTMTTNSTISNCTFMDNTAVYYGGAVYYENSTGNNNIINSTFVGNSSAFGGASVGAYSSYTIIDSSTLISNTFATQGTGSLITVENSIVAGTAAYTSGTITYKGINLARKSSGEPTVDPKLVFTDYTSGTLQKISNTNYVAPIIIGGPAYEKIDITRSLSTGQNGVDRKTPLSDIGAFEAPIEDKIYIPDPNLRKAINNELGRGLVSLPDHFTKKELESLTKLSYGAPGTTMANKIMDLTGLEYAVNLTDISFDYNQISDITNISGLGKLESLSLSNNKIINIPDMNKMVSLEKLDLSLNSISDIRNISDILSLTTLKLNVNSISDISSISKLTNLSIFEAKQNKIEEISSLQNLLNLNTIDLSINKISNIYPVMNLLKLENINFSSNIISDIKPLENLTSLINLSLGRNDISDISYLDKLVNLESLDLILNKVEDISYLSNKIKIKKLILTYNKIKDVTPLKNLNNMEILYLSGNQIMDISSLSGIVPNMTTFDATYQKVNLGKVLVNGNKLSLDNPVKTIEGSLPIITISDSGSYNSINNTINWSNLDLTQTRSFEFEDSNRKFYGEVTFTVERVGIKDPKNPDNDNITPNSEGIQDLNHDLKLAINYIEPIDFGEVDIESGNMEIKAVTKTPYIQLTDLRNASTGWKLGVKGSPLENTGKTISGVEIRLKNGDTKSSPVSYKNLSNTPTIGNDVRIPLDGTSVLNIMEADSGKGSGTWLGIWNGLGTTNENVLMEVPAGKARVGQYTTTLTWELSDTP